MLAMNDRTPLGVRLPALSLTTIASKLAQRLGATRKSQAWFESVLDTDDQIVGAGLLAKAVDQAMWFLTVYISVSAVTAT
ncbi:TPA: hypothetical protein SAN82_005768 [Pseudomonas putida]|nr:hypothetical protein [Pseudomonas putida]